MSKTHIQNTETPTLASEIISDLEEERKKLKVENKNLRETVVTLGLMLTKILKEGDLENENA
uniref:Initiation-control protein YabA, DnaA, DnaN, Zinc finger.7A n=1 Tax=Siphoviridae sp. ctkyp1 TaxID=2825646 RepID=A0A8S5P3S1_9CAUD|nr:MAG TPA: Initiation-control protein YabA, DnaA, DnaN, Zinc finger.7A [Siphoviridae sp. ctkyp1]DAH50194.1 MAG TPA: Initiation-control protein YabA, DnaA, DnaN, Zinc finger.7A [Caudoviricetes sp.]